MRSPFLEINTEEEPLPDGLAGWERKLPFCIIILQSFGHLCESLHKFS